MMKKCHFSVLVVSIPKVTFSNTCLRLNPGPEYVFVVTVPMAVYLALEFTDSLQSNRGLLEEGPGKETTKIHTLEKKPGTTNK